MSPRVKAPGARPMPCSGATRMAMVTATARPRARAASITGSGTRRSLDHHPRTAMPAHLTPDAGSGSAGPDAEPDREGDWCRVEPVGGQDPGPAGGRPDPLLGVVEVDPQPVPGHQVGRVPGPVELLAGPGPDGQ